MEPTKSVKTRIEIIEETAAFYNLSNRSIGGEGPSDCLYDGPDGKQCAFRRMCVDGVNLTEGYTIKRLVGAFPLENILKPEYKGYNLEFYADVQWLHDKHEHWTASGISFQGREYVDKLKEKYA